LSFFGGGTVASGNALADGNHSNGGVNVGCSGSTGFGDPCIGSSGGQLLGTVSGARPARIMQLGLRFIS